VIYLKPSPWTATSEPELSGADVVVYNGLEARNSAQLLVPAVADGPLEEIGAALAEVVAEVVLKRGGHGALAWGDGGVATSHPGFAVEAVGIIRSRRRLPRRIRHSSRRRGVARVVA